MKRELELQRRLVSLRMLGEAVGAMRSLSAHHFRIARAEVEPSSTYRAAVVQALSALDINDGSASGVEGTLLITADLGLCGDYASRLAEALIGRGVAGPVYAVGSRSTAALSRAGIPVAAAYPAPTSVAGVPHLLFTVVEDLAAHFGRGWIGSLTIVSARFEGAGKFTPIWTPVIPVKLPPHERVDLTTQYADRGRLVEIAVREFLHISLYELMIDALASEHGMRLVATQAARHWIDDTVAQTSRSLAASRREETTQELLDIIAASRPLRRGDRSG